MKRVEDFKQVFLHRNPVDMRRGIQGLLSLVIGEKMGELKEESLFVFTGKRRTTIKCLYYNGINFCLWMQQLETDRFPWPKTEENTVILTPEQFEYLLKGIDVWKLKFFKKSEFEHFF